MSRAASLTFFLALAAGLLLLARCESGGTGEPSALVVDDAGRAVELPARVQRVVSLAPSVTETIFAAGGGALLVGVTTADDFPPEVTSLPQLSALPLDYEAVVALRPDLVLASDQINNVQDADALAALEVPVFFVGVRSLDEMIRSVVTVGSLLGTDAAALRAADSLRRSLDALRALTEELSSQPRTLYLIGDATLYAFGRGSYIHSLIALAGGTSVTEDHPRSAPVLTDEYVLLRRPEVLVGSFTSPARLLDHHPTWDIVPAVQSGRIYVVPADLFVRPGPRLVAGAWHLAALLHPERVTAP